MSIFALLSVKSCLEEMYKTLFEANEGCEGVGGHVSTAELIMLGLFHGPLVHIRETVAIPYKINL